MARRYLGRLYVHFQDAATRSDHSSTSPYPALRAPRTKGPKGADSWLSAFGYKRLKAGHLPLVPYIGTPQSIVHVS